MDSDRSQRNTCTHWDRQEPKRGGHTNVYPVAKNVTDGVYYFENNKLIIKHRRYNPHIYLYGGYENIYHEAFVVNENKIQYQRYSRDFNSPEYVDLEFVEDNDLQSKKKTS